MFTKLILLPVLFIALASTALFSQALYSSTDYTGRFNPGIGSLGTPIIAYDDVTIPSAIAAGSDSINITKINIGIRRTPNAPATSVSLYYTALQNDSTGVKTVATASHVFLGKISLPVNGNSLVTSIISLGDSVSTLFKVKADRDMANNGNQKFLIGASFDNPSVGNGIILTKQSDNNLDSIWIDNNNTNSLYATSFSSSLPATYHLEVFGNSVRQNNPQQNSFSDVAAVSSILQNAKK